MLFTTPSLYTDCYYTPISGERQFSPRSGYPAAGMPSSLPRLPFDVTGDQPDGHLDRLFLRLDPGMVEPVGGVHPQPEHESGDLPQEVAEIFAGHLLPAFDQPNLGGAGPVHEFPGQGHVVVHLTVARSPVDGRLTIEGLADSPHHRPDPFLDLPHRFRGVGADRPFQPGLAGE